MVILRNIVRIRSYTSVSSLPNIPTPRIKSCTYVHVSQARSRENTRSNCLASDQGETTEAFAPATFGEKYNTRTIGLQVSWDDDVRDWIRFLEGNSSGNQEKERNKREEQDVGVDNIGYGM